MMHDWIVWARTPTERSLITDWQDFDIVPTVNGIGAHSIKMPLDTQARDVVLADDALIEYWLPGDTDPILRGFVDQTTRSRDATGSWLTVVGACESTLLWERVVIPDAAAEPSVSTGTWSSSHDSRNGVASTVMRSFVDYHLGPNALSSRQAAHAVSIGTDPTVGHTATWKARVSNLGELLTKIADDVEATDGTTLMFRIVNGEFRTFESPDRSAGPGRLSEAMHNLESYEIKRTGPRANRLYVGGSGELTARKFAGVSVIGAGRRIEQFLDQRQLSTLAELRAEGYAKLADMAAVSSISAIPIETTTLTWRSDWELGDTVKLVADGSIFTDAIRSMRITVMGGRETIVPTIGRASALDEVTATPSSRPAEYLMPAWSAGTVKADQQFKHDSQVRDAGT